MRGGATHPSAAAWSRLLHGAWHMSRRCMLLQLKLLLRALRLGRSLIYQMLGDEAEGAFARDWGVGLGFDQATQCQGVLKSVIVKVIILTLMDRGGILGAQQWLEVYLDQVSVQACSGPYDARPPPVRRARTTYGRPYDVPVRRMAARTKCCRPQSAAPCGPRSLYLRPRGSKERTGGSRTI